MTSPTPPSPNNKRAVVIPSYNSGKLLEHTVREVLAVWQPVIVVIDGSTDGTEKSIAALSKNVEGLDVIIRPNNGGKGAAVLTGLGFAIDGGFSHIAVVDADGQHNAPDIPRFMEASKDNPEALIAGVPIFDHTAPLIRKISHVIANFFTHFETPQAHLVSALFGFRVYPVRPSLKIMEKLRGGRGYDFDTQLAVRLIWKGHKVINLKTPVKYRRSSLGTISHFRYWRDNFLLFATHASLLLQSISHRLK